MGQRDVRWMTSNRPVAPDGSTASLPNDLCSVWGQRLGTQAPWSLSLISVPLAFTDLLLRMNPG